MRLTRALAPLAVAAALAVVPAPAAHAGCTEDLLTALGLNMDFVIDPNPDLSPYVEVNGLDVTVHGDAIVATASGVVAFVQGKVVHIVAVAPGALVTYAGCL